MMRSKEYVDRHEMWVEIKYKTVGKKIESLVLPLLLDCEEKIKKTAIKFKIF